MMGRKNSANQCWGMTKAILFGLFIVLVLNLFFKDPINSSVVYPPKKTAIINYLQRKVAIDSPGVNFRGYVATFSTSKTTDWYQQLTFDVLQLIPSLGNDHRTVGLWYFHIPTLFEYSQLLSPALYFLVMKAMSRSSDKQIRNVMVMTKPNFNLLAAMGVKYIIIDRVINRLGIKLVQSEFINKESGSLYLYEIQNANIATYSPIMFHNIRPIQSFISAINKNQIDFSSIAFVQEIPAVSNLVQPIASDIKAIKNGIEFSAESKGVSTVLLPLLYSHCLHLEFIGKKPKIFSMLRANLVETLLIFNQQVHLKISYRTGLLKDAHCRLEDKADLIEVLKAA